MKYRGPRDFRTSTSPGYKHIYKDYSNIEEEKEESKQMAKRPAYKHIYKDYSNIEEEII